MKLPKIAKENIYVYKILKYDNGLYYTPIIKQLVKSNIIKPFSYLDTLITILFKKDKYKGLIYSYSKNREHLVSYENNFVYNAYIPKGSLYYHNEDSKIYKSTKLIIDDSNFNL